MLCRSKDDVARTKRRPKTTDPGSMLFSRGLPGVYEERDNTDSVKGK